MNTRFPGTKRRDPLEQNVGAATVELTADDLREIERAATNIAVIGERYPAHLGRMTGF